MPHSTRTVQKTGFQKNRKNTIKNKAKNPIDKKRPKIKKGQKTKKTLKIKIYTISILSGKSNKKFRYTREMGRSSKNNDFPGDTTQKIDKIQNRAKNVKNRQKTREIEIQYIYI